MALEEISVIGTGFSDGSQNEVKGKSTPLVEPILTPVEEPPTGATTDENRKLIKPIGMDIILIL